MTGSDGGGDGEESDAGHGIEAVIGEEAMSGHGDDVKLPQYCAEYRELLTTVYVLM